MTALARDPDFLSSERRAERAAMVRIGEEVRRLREKKKITLRQLAEKVGLSAPFLSDVEHGRRKLSRLDAVSKVLGVRPMHFLELAGHCPHCKGTGFAIGSNGADPDNER